ncbi:adenosylcobinamide-GDP ribazoletransferase [Saccharomonospora cyanea]|uniref:Adenosylcobinamide-GDP ribazoletransferase n=1 Tax=Saccharomonospora cyanea NA-134 TaxID=882082 RepID=H5XMF8_9PSEU|nr:cobalamin-5-phosphate synthase [Saccharomonospora cyanea NA-134]
MRRNSPVLRDGVLMSVGTLTVLPVAAPSVVNRRVAAVAMVLAPLAALPLAGVAVLAVLAGTWLGLPPFVTAVAAIGAVAFGSRGLHLDGLADVADGLAASYDRDRALAVMRRGDVGPSGVVTLVLVLLGQVAALAGAVTAGVGVPAVAAAVLAGRAVLPLCCVRGVPSARPDGLGAAVAGTVPPWVAGALVSGGLLACAVVPGIAWWHGFLAPVLGWACAAVLLAHAVRRFGGLTGDVLGACVELTTVVVLVVLSVPA